MTTEALTTTTTNTEYQCGPRSTCTTGTADIFNTNSHAVGSTQRDAKVIRYKIVHMRMRMIKAAKA